MGSDRFSKIPRRDFLKLAGAVSAASVTQGAFAETDRHFSIVIDAEDPIASAHPVRWAADQLAQCAEGKGRGS